MIEKIFLTSLCVSLVLLGGACNINVPDGQEYEITAADQAQFDKIDKIVEDFADEVGAKFYERGKISYMKNFKTLSGEIVTNPAANWRVVRYDDSLPLSEISLEVDMMIYPNSQEMLNKYTSEHCGAEHPSITNFVTDSKYGKVCCSIIQDDGYDEVRVFTSIRTPYNMLIVQEETSQIPDFIMNCKNGIETVTELLDKINSQLSL